MTKNQLKIRKWVKANLKLLSAKDKKNEIWAYCPRCGKGNYHFCFTIGTLTEKDEIVDVGHCFKCDYSCNIYTLIKDVLGFSNYKEVAEYFHSEISDKKSIRLILKEITKESTFKATIKDDPRKYNNLDIEKETLGAKFISWDRFKTTTCLWFGVRYCKKGFYRDRFIIPVKSEDYKSFVARRDDSKSDEHERDRYWKQKYLNPPGSKHSYLLFNYNNLSDTDYLVICEGVTDVMRLYEYGIFATCIFGKRISSYQLNLLLRMPKLKRILIGLDNNDPTVAKAVEKNKEKLDGLFTVEVIKWPEGTDPGILSEKIAKACVFKDRGLRDKLKILKS